MSPVGNSHTKLIIGGGDSDVFVTEAGDSLVKIDFFYKSREWSKLVVIHWHNTLDEQVYCAWHGYDGKKHGGWRQPNAHWSSQIFVTHPVSCTDSNGNQLLTGHQEVFVTMAYHDKSTISVTRVTPPAHINTDPNKTVHGGYGTIFLSGDWMLEEHPSALTSIANGEACEHRAYDRRDGFRKRKMWCFATQYESDMPTVAISVNREELDFNEATKWA